MAGAPFFAIAPATTESTDRAPRYISLRLLPFLFVLYITNYLDRTSVAYAAIGMARDLDSTIACLAWGSAFFFSASVAFCRFLAQCWPNGGAVLVPATGHARVPKSIGST
jgi:hypothetical protein